MEKTPEQTSSKFKKINQFIYDIIDKKGKYDIDHNWLGAIGFIVSLCLQYTEGLAICGCLVCGSKYLDLKKDLDKIGLDKN